MSAPRGRPDPKALRELAGRRRVVIQSDGTLRGTLITDASTGEPIPMVRSVSFRADGDEPATAELQILVPQLEATLEADVAVEGIDLEEHGLELPSGPWTIDICRRCGEQAHYDSGAGGYVCDEHPAAETVRLTLERHIPPPETGTVKVQTMGGGEQEIEVPAGARKLRQHPAGRKIEDALAAARKAAEEALGDQAMVAKPAEPRPDPDDDAGGGASA